MFRLLALCGPDEPDAQKLFAPGRFSCFCLAPGRIMFSLITLNYITTAAQVASHGRNALPCARRCGKCRLLLRHKPGTPAKQTRIIAPSLLKTAQSGDILYRKGVNAPFAVLCADTNRNDGCSPREFYENPKPVACGAFDGPDAAGPRDSLFANHTRCCLQRMEHRQFSSCRRHRRSKPNDGKTLKTSFFNKRRIFAYGTQRRLEIHRQGAGRLF